MANVKEVLTKPEINFMLSITAPFIALAVTWGVLSARLDYVEKMVIGLQDTYRQQQETNLEIQVKLAEIQKDIAYIRKSFDSYVDTRSCE
jgi:hypothetical protein